MIIKIQFLPLYVESHLALPAITGFIIIQIMAIVYLKKSITRYQSSDSLTFKTSVFMGQE
jgi:hypothetical protein